MTVQSVTASHVTGGNAFATSGVISSTETFFYYYIAFHKENNFYIENTDGADTVNWRVIGFHKAHNFPLTSNTTLPADVITTVILAATGVTAGNFSANQAISDTAGYSHIAIGLVRAAAADIDDVNIFGWGRLRGG